MKTLIPLIIFIFSSFFSLVSLPLAIAIFICGLILVSTIQVRKNMKFTKSNFLDSNPVLMSSGLVLLFTPIITVGIVTAGIAGFFS